jgi:cytochrome b
LIVESSGPSGASRRERVWDPLVRVFHWSLVAAFAAAWYGRSESAIHETAGMIVLALIIIRAAWGITGTGSARFETFIKGPVAVIAYVWAIIRGKPAHYIGHNPAGAAMIGLMLLALFATAASGILMTTTAFWGGAVIEKVHGTAANLMLLLIAGHLAGIAAASVQHRENLPLAMIRGRKWVPPGTPRYLGPMACIRRRIVLALAVICLSSSTWLASTTLFNASFWRMEKIIASEANRLGCTVLGIQGPHIEIYPFLAIRYSVALKSGARPLRIDIPAHLAFERRPAIDFTTLSAQCAYRKSQITAAAYQDMALSHIIYAWRRPAP